MLTAQERKNKQVGWTISIIIHLLLLIFFILWKIWPFDPPLAPRYGIEVNFGTTDVGSGDVQTETPPNENTTEEIVEESSESNESDSETDVENVESESSESSEESVSEVVESDVESYVEEAEESNSTNEDVNTDTNDSESKEESQEESTNSNSESNTENTNNNSNPYENNNGDDQNLMGDKGHEEGKVDAENLYGTPGGGNGFSTNIVGWVPDFSPKPKDNTNENGKIVFKVTIDDEGDIINIVTIEKTVSPAVEAIYRKEVEKLTFSKTRNNSVAAPTSTGTITFLIKSK